LNKALRSNKEDKGVSKPSPLIKYPTDKKKYIRGKKSMHIPLLNWWHIIRDVNGSDNI
jgi:hypothetical protein